MNKIEAVGLGALNTDHIYRVEHILEDGESLVDEVGVFPGGSAANTLYGLARLGIGSGFVGAVGDDNEGALLVQDFEEVGVDTSRIITKRGVKSGSTLCLSAVSGERSIYVIPAANNLLTMSDINLPYINQARLLHISSFADDRQFQLLIKLMDEIAPSVKVSFSPGELYANRGIKSLVPIISRTHILFVNQSEIRKLTGKDFAAGAKICLEHDCRIVVVTLGAAKKLSSNETATAVCYVRDAGNEFLIEPVSQIETTVDTTGAGDAFATGFLYGLIKGKELKVCAMLGDIVAQYSVTQIGARQGLPTATQLAQRYTELYNKRL